MNKKSFAFVLAAAALGLAACGEPSNPGESKSGAAPTSSVKASASKTSKSTTSRAPVKSASFDTVGLTKKDNKMYLVLTGTTANLEATDQLKATVGLMVNGSAVVDGEGTVTSPATWVLGKEAPADADYTYTPTVENKSIKLEISLSDISAMQAGDLIIYAGIKGYMDYAPFGTDLDEASGDKDGRFRYYTRNSIQGADGLALVVEELSPIALTDAKVVAEGEKLYAMWGGATTKTLDELKAYNSFVDFQRMGQYSVARYSQLVDEPAEGTNYYSYVFEGDKAFVKADITNVFKAGERWMTHYNGLKSTQGNCVMDVTLDQVYTFDAFNLKIRVYSNPAAGQLGKEAEFYGCLGFEISAINEEVAAE